MRHFYFRVTLGIIFFACLIFSLVTINLSGAGLFTFMSAAMFYGAYGEWKRNGGGRV